MPQPLDLSVALLRPLAARLDAIGADGAGLLAALAIDGTTPADAFVAGAEVDRLLDERAERRGDRAFGLTLARAAVAQPLGLLSHLLWLSGTLGDALAHAVRYYGAVSRRTQVTLEVDERGELAALRRRPVAGVPCGAILTEFAFASMVLRARAATGGRFALRAIRFAHPAPAPVPAIYREVFGVPARFGADVDELRFARRELTRGLASADPITAAALEPSVAVLATPPTDLTARLQRVIAQDLAAPPTLAGAAARLGVSPRTLRRHLEREGASLRVVIDDVRRQHAALFLGRGAAIKEVAMALGFSEPSAFSRAYKRWHGRPPSASGR